MQIIGLTKKLNAEQLQQHSIDAMRVKESYSKNIKKSILPGDELIQTPGHNCKETMLVCN